MADPTVPSGAQDASTAELMRQLSQQMSLLVRQEVALAKAELTEKGKQAGIGAGMFGGAGVVGLYSVGALVAAAIAGLSLAVATWLAALIVAAALGVAAGLLALQGRSRLKVASPPAPERTVESVKEDAEVMKRRAQNARTSDE